VINETNLKGCPGVILRTENREITAILGSRADISVILEETYNSLIAGGA
jgi:hypothetical protein